MKKILLLIMMCIPAALLAQNGVIVSGLTVNAGTLTFNVSWDRDSPVMPAVWSDSVWVFVDYNEVMTMTRLPLITSGATLTATSAPGVGKIIVAPGNNQGVWVVGNAKSAGSFSATIKLLTATATADFPGACAYASNYPPVGAYTSPLDVSFTGTPDFEITLTDTQSGATSTARSEGSFTLFPGYGITAFTDATGAPGTFHCIPPAAPTVAKGEFCYEQPGALVASSSGSVIIEWYDAMTGGTLLHTGEVLSLPPLYNTSAQYYAQAMYVDHCRSLRTAAEYTVSNCPVPGTCPNYTAGSIAALTTPAACTAHYAGQIGAAAVPAACMAHDAGRIGQ